MQYKIYLGHTRDPRLNYLDTFYQPLIAALHEHTLIMPHPNGADAVINSCDVLPKCDAMIAEVSYPSTGLGMELAWAKIVQVPILCLHHTTCTPSHSVLTHFSSIISYENTLDMVQGVAHWLGQ